MTTMSVGKSERAAVHIAQRNLERARAIAIAKIDLSNNFQLQKVIIDKGMGGLQLPFVQENETLEEAMRRMRSLKRGAVVVGYTGPDYRLYMNRNVMDARREGVVECSGLLHFAGAIVALLALKAEGEESDFSELSPDLFERHSADYGLLAEPGANDLSVYLLTRTHELAQSILQAVVVCECMDGHEYHEPPPVHGTICEHDGTMISCLP